MWYSDSLAPKKQILKCGQQAVGNVFVERHTALESSAAKNSRPKDYIVYAARDHTCHRRDERGRVLVVGMDHDNDVGAGFKGLAVAGLLVAPITVV